MANNLGILVVHLVGENRRLLSYDHGTLEEGLSRVAEVLKCAALNEYPIFTTGNHHPYDSTLLELHPGLLDSEAILLGDVKHPFRDRNFREYDELFEIKRYVIMGFNRTVCVRAAINNLRENGRSVATSPDLLFGNVEWPESPEEVLAHYREKTTLYENHEALIRQEFGVCALVSSDERVRNKAS